MTTWRPGKLSGPFVANDRLLWGRDPESGERVYIEPGQDVPIEDGRRYDVMLEFGEIKWAEDRPVHARRGTGPVVPAELNELSKSELWNLAKNAGIDPEEVEGSGAHGNVLKDDLIAALEKARH